MAAALGACQSITNLAGDTSPAELTAILLGEAPGVWLPPLSQTVFKWVCKHVNVLLHSCPSLARPSAAMNGEIREKGN